MTPDTQVSQYLDDGFLVVIPGSHRSCYIDPFRPHGQPDEFDPTDEAYGFDTAGTVTVEVSAGSTTAVATEDDRNVVPIGPDPSAWKGYGECPDRVLIRPASGEWG